MSRRTARSGIRGMLCLLTVVLLLPRVADAEPGIWTRGVDMPTARFEPATGSLSKPGDVAGKRSGARNPRRQQPATDRGPARLLARRPRRGADAQRSGALRGSASRQDTPSGV